VRPKNFYIISGQNGASGVGEAGGKPTPHTSIISDYFPLKQRSHGFVIYQLAIYIGVVNGLFVIGGF